MKIISLILGLFLLASCSVKVNSVLDNRPIQKAYPHASIVIVGIDEWTNKYAYRLKAELQSRLSHKNIDILVSETQKMDVSLEQFDNRGIIQAGEGEPSSLILTCGVKSLLYSDENLISGEFVVLGYDTELKAFIWEIQYNMNSKTSPSRFAEKSGKAIVEKMLKDKII